MVLRVSIRRYVLWRQDFRHYIPPYTPAGWVAGRTLMRYPATAPVPLDTDALSKPTLAWEEWASTEWRPSDAPVEVVLNASDGCSLHQTTPMSSADVARCVQHLASKSAARKTDDEGQEYAWQRCQQRWNSLSQLVSVVREHQMLLAGAEALQTGAPLEQVLRFMEEAVVYLECSVQMAIHQWRELEGGSGSDSGAHGALPTCSYAAATADFYHDIESLRRQLRGDCHCLSSHDILAERATNTVLLCLTPLYHSVSSAMKATAVALTSGCVEHVVWRPSCGTSLAAAWLMVLLRRESEAAPVSPPPLHTALPTFRKSPAFHVMLTGGDAERHIIRPVATANLLAVAPAGLLCYGCPPSQVHHSTALWRRSHDNLNVRVDSHPPLCVLRPATPSVTLLRRAAAAAEAPQCLTAALSSSSPPSSVAAHQRSAPRPLPSPSATYLSSPAAAASLVYQRGFGQLANGIGPAPLCLVPQSMARVLLREMASRHLSGPLHLGHSLDRSSQLGPLPSAAHLAVAEQLLQAATSTGDGQRRHMSEEPIGYSKRERTGTYAHVKWQHVCGGFRLPLTAMNGPGAYLLPCLLFADAQQVMEEQQRQQTMLIDGGKERDSGAEIGAAILHVMNDIRQLVELHETELLGFGGAVMGRFLFLCSYPDEAEGPVYAALQGQIQTSLEGASPYLWWSMKNLEVRH